MSSVRRMQLNGFASDGRQPACRRPEGASKLATYGCYPISETAWLLRREPFVEVGLGGDLAVELVVAGQQGCV